ncbi:hypothetical protein K1719_031170 [Acacia pycnantha]|nr:hypothetical protein K1719_031170 [Acacia pycnantha]
MSPASRSKSRDKRAGKEAQKAPAKPTGPVNAGAAIPANETEEYPGVSVIAGVDCDSVSNNDSLSGESVPGADIDKREKIRQKNERKHQRQKERRAQELHERCSGYLMSRKLEALAQQLLAMGFSHERATMALILNEGKMEESVAWLFEGGEETDNQKDKNVGGSNLKIDISEELSRIADMETKFGCSKQEVERAVVACEGDLEKAADSVRELKLDPPFAPPKPEENGDPPIVNNGKQPGVVSQNTRPLTRPIPSPNQLKKDEKDLNCTKAAVMAGVSSESSNKSVLPIKRIQPKSEWAKPQQAPIPADKRWPSAASNPSVSYSLASPLQVAAAPSTKSEARYMAVGGEYKNLQPGSAREPIMVMQRPQTANVKQVLVTSISPSSIIAASWHPNGEVTRSNGFLPHTPSTRNLNAGYLSSNQMYHQLHYQPHQQLVPGGSNSVDLQAASLGNRTGASPMLSAAASLGLFSGLGSAATSGASSAVDWNTGGSMQFDYANIDWSLDRGLPSPTSNALWVGLSPFTKGNSSNIYNSNTSGLVTQPSMRSFHSNGSIVPLPGLQDGGIASAEVSAGSSSREWSSPFEGKDLFSLPRQFVSSPSP